MNKKNYAAAPLPFMGQKRRFAGEFKNVLKEFRNVTLFVDLFGGSGLLSHITKQERPDARVIYNDYDGYHERLANIERTNRLIAELREITTGIPHEKRLPADIRQRILLRVKEEERTGFVDYITVSSSLFFSMKYAKNFDELSKQSMYNCVRTTKYICTGYLEGVDRVCMDYKELFARYKDEPNALFIVDPPYLSTDAGTYKGYWKLNDYLDVLSVLVKPYIYFTSNKSSILELCDWIKKNLNAKNPFDNTVISRHNVALNYNSKCKDIMIYKTCTPPLDYYVKIAVLFVITKE